VLTSPEKESDKENGKRKRGAVASKDEKGGKEASDLVFRGRRGIVLAWKSPFLIEKRGGLH